MKKQSSFLTKAKIKKFIFSIFLLPPKASQPKFQPKTQVELKPKKLRMSKQPLNHSPQPFSKLVEWQESSTGDQSQNSTTSRLETLEQRHIKTAHFYQTKIRELNNILQRQNSLRCDLTQQIMQLSRQAQEQNAQLHTLAQQVTPKSTHNLQLIRSQYLLPCSDRHLPANEPRIIPGNVGSKMSRGKLFSSDQIGASLKVSKSQTLISSKPMLRSQALKMKMGSGNGGINQRVEK